MCSAGPARGPHSVVSRAMTLLAAFGPSDGELTLAELSRRTGLPKSTAHRLIAELAEWGVLERTAGGIRLGMRLFELGALVPRQRSLRDAAGPFLAELADVTGQTVHLAVPDGAEVVYVQKLDGRGGPALPTRVGGRMPASCTAVGKALLALGPPEGLAVAVGAGLQRRTPRSVVAPGHLARDLALARRRGHAEEHEESVIGVACVAAPVVDGDGRALAAVSVTGWANRWDAARLALPVRAAARAIERAVRG